MALYKDNPRMAQKLISRINQRAHFSKKEDRPAVAELIKLILKCMEEKEEFYLEEVKGLTRALLMQIARWNEKDEEQERNSIVDDASVTLILPALDYIGENFQESIRIEELAEVCHISETHLRRIFQESMRMPPVEYINWVRIRAACKELRKTNASVNDIAQCLHLTVIFERFSAFLRSSGGAHRNTMNGIC